MAGVNDRRSRPTLPYDSQRLAKETEDDVEVEDVEFALAADPPPVHPHVVPQAGSRIAAGTTPPQGLRPVAVVIDDDDVPHEPRARTTTVHDPMTTSVLAEVARRTKTIETEPLPLPSDFQEEDTRPTGIRRAALKRDA
jgi:hypothetical protein